MKLSKRIILLGTLGVVLLAVPELQASTCDCVAKTPCAEAKPCCAAKKCCKPGIASRISWGIASIFEGTGAAIGWPFRKAGDMFLKG